VGQGLLWQVVTPSPGVSETGPWRGGPDAGCGRRWPVTGLCLADEVAACPRGGGALGRLRLRCGVKRCRRGRRTGWAVGVCGPRGGPPSGSIPALKVLGYYQ